PGVPVRLPQGGRRAVRAAPAALLRAPLPGRRDPPPRPARPPGHPRGPRHGGDDALRGGDRARPAAATRDARSRERLVLAVLAQPLQQVPHRLRRERTGVAHPGLAARARQVASPWAAAQNTYVEGWSASAHAAPSGPLAAAPGSSASGAACTSA